MHLKHQKAMRAKNTFQVVIIMNPMLPSQRKLFF